MRRCVRLRFRDGLRGSSFAGCCSLAYPLSLAVTHRIYTCVQCTIVYLYSCNICASRTVVDRGLTVGSGLLGVMRTLAAT